MEPQPLPITESGGKRIANKTRQKLILENLKKIIHYTLDATSLILLLEGYIFHTKSLYLPL